MLVRQQIDAPLPLIHPARNAYRLGFWKSPGQWNGPSYSDAFSGGKDRIVIPRWDKIGEELAGMFPELWADCRDNEAVASRCCNKSGVEVLRMRRVVFGRKTQHESRHGV